MDLTVRLAKHDDRNDIFILLCEVFGHEYKKLANDYIDAMFSNDFRKPTFIVAEYNNEIIGCAVYTEELFTINVWGISWVAVKEEYRKNKIGKKLIEQCLNEIRVKIKSPVTIILATYPNKTGLYDKTGFKMLGHDHEGGAFMTLTLHPL